MNTLKKYDNLEFSQMSDTSLREVMFENYIQFEHVTILAMDRYKTHYIFEYHHQFPQKDAKTQALFTFLNSFNQ